MSRTIGNIPANEMLTAEDVAGLSTSASGLTDAELRAAPVAVDVFDWPAVQSFNLLDFVNGNGARVKATTPLSNDYGLVTRNIPSGSQTVDGTVAVSNFPSVQPVSGAVTVANPTANPETGLAKNATLTDGTQKTQVTNFPATQPVSGPLTDTQLRAAAVPVSVGNFPATQPVSGPLTDTQLRASAVPVSVSNFPSTQPVSAAALPLPAGASTETTLAAIKAKTDNLDVLLSSRTKPGDTQVVEHKPALSCVSSTAAVGVGVTATLPAAAGLFHYVTMIQIVKYATATIAGAAAPVVVTTTNLPGSLAFTFETAQAIGTRVKDELMPTNALKSSAANVATTIVCPATTNVIWRVNVFFYAG